MNYSEMLDFEINVQVAEVTGKHADYCNSWSDAGPIIGQHGINMLFNFDVPFCYKPERDSHGVPFTRFKYQDANPLRAAMTVFLMMQEGVNA